MDVDSQPSMEETILVGDDLMLGPPSPIIPPEIASHVLEGVECAENRDKELRQRLQDSEHKLGLSMPLDDAKDRATQLQSEVTSLERRLILASGMEGMEGFRQRWSLHGCLEDTKKRLDSLNQGMQTREKEETKGTSTASKRWFFQRAT